MCLKNKAKTLHSYALIFYIEHKKVRILRIGLWLIAFWIFAVYSVSIHESFTLTLKLFENQDPSNYFYFYRHLRNIVIAIIMWLVVYRIPLKFFQNNKNIIIISVIIFVLQLMVFIPWIGVSLNWARWWIDIPFLPSIQPSEFFKLWYVIFLSSWLLRKKKNLNKPEFVLAFIIMNAILLWLFLLIPDLWTVLILWVVWLVMARYVGLELKKIIMIAWLWVIATFVVGWIAWMISPRFEYIQKRFTYFLSSDVDPQSRQIWWQNQQALIAIWWWWFIGKWYGKWLQKFWFIPEAQSDFIFAAFSEELWLMGNLFLLWLYFSLMYYFIKNLSPIKDENDKTLGIGIISLIIIQMFINIWVNTKILPNTWLTLPFISHGWTAIMVNVIELFILYKIIKRK